MKKGSKSVYRFIHQLEPVEKRYFKKYASRHIIGQRNNYYALYEAIDDQDFSSDDEARSFVSGKKMSGYFPVAKKQLFDSLLDALHDFDKASNIKEEVKAGIHKATILLNRGFVKDCASLVRKYKKKIRRYELHNQMIELLGLEKQLIAKAFYNQINSGDLERLYNEEKQYIDYLQRENEYWILQPDL